MAQKDDEGYLADRRHATALNDFITMMSASFDVVGIEMPYAFFGYRGVLDAVLRSKEPVDGKCCWLLCEIKPDLSDIGEAIRQVKKAERFFFKDEDMAKLLGGGPVRIVCPLALLATEANLARCMQYHRLLKDVDIFFFSKDPALTTAIAGKYEVFRAMTAFQEKEQATRAGTASPGLSTVTGGG